MATAGSPALNVAASGDREVVWSRVFDAPRGRVFDAWTKPELVARWFGRRAGWTTKAEIDLRVGGTYRFTMTDESGRTIVLRGEYREISRPDRLVTAEAFEGFSESGWRPEDATVSTIIFTESAGKTTWTMTQTYPSKRVRDAVMADPNARGGMAETFAHLDAILRAR